MKVLVIVFVVFGCMNFIYAQEAVPKKYAYRTWVCLNSEPFMVKGFLYEANDSSISVTSSGRKTQYSRDREKVTNLHINNIETIEIRKKNNIGKGVLIGTLAGLAATGVLRLAVNDDPAPTSASTFGLGGGSSMTANGKAMFFGSFFVLGGASFGSRLGYRKKTIHINGRIDNYDSIKNELREYSIKN